MFRRTLVLSNVAATLVPLALMGNPALSGESNRDQQAPPSAALNAASPTFTEIKKLQAEDAGFDDRFGAEGSAISGDTIVVGAHLADSGAPDAGAAYVFGRNEGGEGNWGLIKKLQVDNPQFGDRFGPPSVSGDTVVVGGFGNDTGGTNAGAAYVFGRNEGGKSLG